MSDVYDEVEERYRAWLKDLARRLDLSTVLEILILTLIVLDGIVVIVGVGSFFVSGP